MYQSVLYSVSTLVTGHGAVAFNYLAQLIADIPPEMKGESLALVATFQARTTFIYLMR